MARRLRAAGDSLILYPERARLVGGMIRELVIISPYIIRYQVMGDRVTIIRIRHAAQL